MKMPLSIRLQMAWSCLTKPSVMLAHPAKQEGHMVTMMNGPWNRRQLEHAIIVFRRTWDDAPFIGEEGQAEVAVEALKRSLK